MQIPIYKLAHILNEWVSVYDVIRSTVTKKNSIDEKNMQIDRYTGSSSHLYTYAMEIYSIFPLFFSSTVCVCVCFVCILQCDCVHHKDTSKTQFLHDFLCGSHFINCRTGIIH